MPTEAKLIAVLILLAAITGGAFLYTEHERGLGEAKIEAADKAAEAKIASQVAQQTAEWKARADMADKGAADAQQKLNDYMASIGTAPVRVCHANGSGAGLPKGAPTPGTASSAGTLARTLPAVPDGTAGPDIRAGLDTLVRAAAEVSINLAEFQQR